MKRFVGAHFNRNRALASPVFSVWTRSLTPPFSLPHSFLTFSFFILTPPTLTKFPFHFTKKSPVNMYLFIAQVAFCFRGINGPLTVKSSQLDQISV